MKPLTSLKDIEYKLARSRVSRILARVSTGLAELQEKYTPATFILVLITKCKLFYVRLLF
jgi:hypothetical protein